LGQINQSWYSNYTSFIFNKHPHLTPTLSVTGEGVLINYLFSIYSLSLLGEGAPTYVGAGEVTNPSWYYPIFSKYKAGGLILEL